MSQVYGPAGGGTSGTTGIPGQNPWQAAVDPGSRQVYMGATRSQQVVTIPRPGSQVTSQPHPGDTDPRLAGSVRSWGAPYSAVAGVDTPDLLYADDAVGSFFTWDDAERKRFGDRLVELGLADAADAYKLATQKAAWTDAVDVAANFYAAGKNVTPWQALANNAGIEGSGGKKAAASRSYTSTSIDLTSPLDAKALISDTLSKYLGRAANDAEVSTFTNTLNNAQKASPTVTQTTQTANGDSTSTTSGGVSAASAGQMAKDYAQAKPDYAEYQAAGTYMNYLFGALSAPVKI